jgi:hypothetical protein
MGSSHESVVGVTEPFSVFFGLLYPMPFPQSSTVRIHGKMNVTKDLKAWYHISDRD